MKRFFIAILSLLYICTSTGATVHMHYCMGKLIGLELDYSAKSGCSNCGMSTKAQEGCCDNKQIQVKVDKEQQVTYNNISLFNPQIAIAPEYPIIDGLLHNSAIIAHPSIHGPPLITHIPVYLFNCNFRI